MKLKRVNKVSRMNKEEIIRKILDPKISERKLIAIEQILKDGDMDVASSSGFLSVKDACKYLGSTSRTTLWHMRNKGLPFFKIGNRVMFSPEDLRSFMTMYRCSEKNNK